MRVVASNKRGLEGFSPFVGLTTKAAPPSQVGNITHVANDDGRSLLLKWEQPNVPNGEVSGLYKSLLRVQKKCSLFLDQ